MELEDGASLITPEDAGSRKDGKRKPYREPEILYDLALETRAGTPLSIDPLDPTGVKQP